jgi:hypothetical protein
LVANYRLAYGFGWQFKVIRLPKKYHAIITHCAEGKNNMTKQEALANYLGIVDQDDLEKAKQDDYFVEGYNENVFEHGSQQYLVLTDEEADEMAKEQILDSLWAFNASFIVCHAKDGINDAKAIKLVQEKLCEDATPLIRALLKDEDHFVNDAISSDGRGHFLSSYDGEENEEGEYFIYRVN